VLPAHLDVVADFRQPACPYCAGQRGIEYSAPDGSAATAAASGVVTFAGSVGGVRYVVLRTPEGVLVTHGLLREVQARRGEQVRRGETIGQSGERLYIGVRVGGRYVDPRHCAAGAKRPRAVLVR